MTPPKPKAMQDSITVTREHPDCKPITARFATSSMTSRTPPQKTAQTLPRTAIEANDPYEVDDDGTSKKQEAAPMKQTGAPMDTVHVLKTAKEKLAKMNTSGANRTVRVEVMAMLEDVIQQMEKDGKKVAPQQNLNTEGHRLTPMENDIKEIKAAVKEAMAAKPTTYAQAAAATTMGTSEPARRQNIEAAKKERQEMIKQEKGKKEVVLTARNASENMKKQVEIMQEAEIAKGIQEAIEGSNIKHVKIRSVRKTPNHMVIVQCSDENDAELVRKLDWELAFQGLSVVKRLYGFVVHGVPKSYIDTECQTQE